MKGKKNGSLYKNAGNTLSMNLSYNGNSSDTNPRLPAINIHNGKKVVYLGKQSNPHTLPPFRVGKYRSHPTPAHHPSPKKSLDYINYEEDSALNSLVLQEYHSNHKNDPTPLSTPSNHPRTPNSNPHPKTNSKFNFTKTNLSSRADPPNYPNTLRRIEDSNAYILPNNITNQTEKNTLKNLILNSWHSLIEIIEQRIEFSDERHNLNMEKVVKARELDDKIEDIYEVRGGGSNSGGSDYDGYMQADVVQTRQNNVTGENNVAGLKIGTKRQYYPDSGGGSDAYGVGMSKSQRLTEIQGENLGKHKKQVAQNLGGLQEFGNRASEWSFRLGSLLKNKLYMFEYIKKGIELGKLEFYDSQIDIAKFQSWYFKDERDLGIMKAVLFVMEETYGFKDRLRYEVFARNMGIKVNVVQYGSNLVRLRTYEQDSACRSGNINHEI